MVETAIIVPDEAAEHVASTVGELTVEALYRVYSKETIEGLQRRALEAEGGDSTVLVRLEGPESDIVQEAAQREGKPAHEWVRDVVYQAAENPPEMGYLSLEQQVESAILRHY